MEGIILCDHTSPYIWSPLWQNKAYASLSSLYFLTLSLSSFLEILFYTTCVYDGGRRRKKYGGRASQAEEPKRHFTLSYYCLCYPQHFCRRMRLLFLWCCGKLSSYFACSFLLQIYILQSVNTMLIQNWKSNTVCGTKIIMKSYLKAPPITIELVAFRNWANYLTSRN